MFLSLVCFCTCSTPEGSIGSKVSITLTTTTNLHRVSRVFWGAGGGISQSKHLGTILNGIKTVVTMRNEGTYGNIHISHLGWYPLHASPHHLQSCFENMARQVMGFHGHLDGRLGQDVREEGEVDRKDTSVLDRVGGIDHYHLPYHYNRYHVVEVGRCHTPNVFGTVDMEKVSR